MTHSPVAAVEEVAAFGVEEDSTVEDFTAAGTGAVLCTLDVTAAAPWQLEVSTEGRLTEAVSTAAIVDTALRD